MSGSHITPAGEVGAKDQVAGQTSQTGLMTSGLSANPWTTPAWTSIFGATSDNSNTKAEPQNDSADISHNTSELGGQTQTAKSEAIEEIKKLDGASKSNTEHEDKAQRKICWHGGLQAACPDPDPTGNIGNGAASEDAPMIVIADSDDENVNGTTGATVSHQQVEQAKKRHLGIYNELQARKTALISETAKREEQALARKQHIVETFKREAAARAAEDKKRALHHKDRIHRGDDALETMKAKSDADVEALRERMKATKRKLIKLGMFEDIVASLAE